MLSGGNNFFFGKDGDIVFSKNNVCVHEVATDDNDSEIVTLRFLKFLYFKNSRKVKTILFTHQDI